MYIRAITDPVAEPVSVQEAKDYLHVLTNDEDDLIAGLVQTAREQCETFTHRAIAQRKFIQVLDAFPYFTDTVQSQQGMNPTYQSLPRYSTTLYNYSQQIKLFRPPLKQVDFLQYIDTFGNPIKKFPGTDFVLDPVLEYARIFPLPGQFWPAAKYVINAVVIQFTAGYDPNPKHLIDINNGTDESPEESPEVDEDITVSLPTPANQQPGYELTLGIPQTLRTAILALTAHYYFNREPVVAGGASELPLHVTSMLWSYRVEDFIPTRG
jgi:hypothetical protein